MFTLNDIGSYIENDTINISGLDAIWELNSVIKEKNLTRLYTIFHIWLAYQFYKSENPTLIEKALNLIKEFIKDIKSDEVELFRPCNHIEWFLNEFGKILLIFH